MNIQTKEQDIVVEITGKEVQADLESGLDEDEVLQAGRHVFRRGGFLARHGLTSDAMLASDKVRVALDLDSDVVAYFQALAAKPNGIPYDAQINAALRQVMVAEQG
jgi:uncharacterized protein (DUF4415 family)